MKKELNVNIPNALPLICQCQKGLENVSWICYVVHFSKMSKWNKFESCLSCQHTFLQMPSIIKSKWHCFDTYLLTWFIICHKQHKNSYFCSFLLIYGRHGKLDVLLCTILNRILSFKAVAVSEAKEPLKRLVGLRIYVCCILVHILPTYGNLKFNQWLIFLTTH